jgi:CheY-like chemotaxis protein
MKRVLVVDDNDDLRELVRITLERGPFEVLEAADGQQALAAVQQTRPDLVLLDIEIPEVDGFAVCQRIKHDPTTAPIKVIMLTAAVQPEDRARAAAAGADGYVTKPFSLKSLISRLETELALTSPATT